MHLILQQFGFMTLGLAITSTLITNLKRSPLWRFLVKMCLTGHKQETSWFPWSNLNNTVQEIVFRHKHVTITVSSWVSFTSVAPGIKNKVTKHLTGNHSRSQTPCFSQAWTSWLSVKSSVFISRLQHKAQEMVQMNLLVFLWNTNHTFQKR